VGRGDAVTSTELACTACGIELPANSKFCNGCGAPVTVQDTCAEFKQVTVLFADVVHSMDIAAAGGAERLREIMAELSDRCAAVVQRYGSTVTQWTGDGIMAVFGAPIALEDHAVRACLAALDLQQEATRLAVDVGERDGIDLRLRVGLNSGEVIAGGMGSGQFGYATVGEQVGMAQRMESVAPPGGVMLSASTARLVEGAAALGESELVQIKGADAPVPARRLLGLGDGPRAAVIARQADAGGIDKEQLGVGAVAGVVSLNQTDGLAVTAAARRHRPCGAVHHRRHDVVVKIRAHAGQVEYDPYADVPKVLLRTNSGQHEQLGRADGACGEHDFAGAGERNRFPFCRAVFHAGAAAVLDPKPVHGRLRDELEIRPAQRR
jgi:class 3 adenylate cyclase